MNGVFMNDYHPKALHTPQRSFCFSHFPQMSLSSHAATLASLNSGFEHGSSLCMHIHAFQSSRELSPSPCCPYREKWAGIWGTWVDFNPPPDIVSCVTHVPGTA